MAIYHLNAKTIGRSQGRSATGAAAYRAGTRIEDARTGLVFDYTRKRGVDGAEIITPDGEALDRAQLWNAVEQSERRIDAQLAREIEVALPRELTPEQMRDTVRAFVRDNFTSAGMVADVAFHHLGGSNPHAHILLTLRDWRDGGFGKKRREWNDRALCRRWREGWADCANEALAQAGHASRIDHRTLAEQTASAIAEGRHEDAIALDRLPTRHERGNSGAIAHNAAVRQANAERLAEWARLEPSAAAPKAPPPRRSRAELLAEEDEAFASEMRSRKDSTARRWRLLDDQARDTAAWLAAEAGGDSRRLAARDQTAKRLRIARHSRDDWREDHPRPFWFWKWPAWRRDSAAAQAAVEAAKRAAARAARQASPEAITAWRRAFEERHREHAATVAARQALAPLPSEQAEAERRRELDRRQKSTWGRRTAKPAPQMPTKIEDTAAARPRPRRRPR